MTTGPPGATRAPRSRAFSGAPLRAVLLLAGTAAVGALVAGVLFVAGAVFADPAWLHLGWASVAVVLLDARATAWRRRRLAAIGDVETSRGLIEHHAEAWRAARAVALSSALVLLAVACARPQWGATEEEIRRRGADVFVCVDTSRSMLAQDVKPSRLERAKMAVSSFVDRLAGDRVGLIAFAGDARMLCPLTVDHAAAKLFLDVLEPNLLDRPGTAIAPALRLALRSLPPGEARSAAVVLLTDGEDHEGQAEEAAQELAKAGIVVYTVGIGRAEGVPIPAETGAQGAGWLRDEQGNAVISKLDAPILRKIADVTGGEFITGATPDVEMSAVASRVQELAHRDLSATRRRVRTDRYGWFLGAALALMALEAFLPDGAPFRSRRGALVTPRVAAAAARSSPRRGERTVAA